MVHLFVVFGWVGGSKKKMGGAEKLLLCLTSRDTSILIRLLRVGRSIELPARSRRIWLTISAMVLFISSGLQKTSWLSCLRLTSHMDFFGPLNSRRSRDKKMFWISRVWSEKSFQVWSSLNKNCSLASSLASRRLLICRTYCSRSCSSFSKRGTDHFCSHISSTNYQADQSLERGERSEIDREESSADLEKRFFVFAYGQFLVDGDDCGSQTIPSFLKKVFRKRRNICEWPEFELFLWLLLRARCTTTVIIHWGWAFCFFPWWLWLVVYVRFSLL